MYNPNAIYQFAGALYQRANLIVATDTIIGAVVGALMGSAYGNTGFSSNGNSWAILGLLVAGTVGYFIGSGRALSLRVQAQLLLSQVAIEENTRKVVEIMRETKHNSTTVLASSTMHSTTTKSTGGHSQKSTAPTSTTRHNVGTALPNPSSRSTTVAVQPSASVRKPKRCTECGADIPGQLNFCPRCSSKVA